MMTPTLDYAYIKVKVQNPVKEPSCSSYISYEIYLETNDPCFTISTSSTRRRYSDFRVLHSMLCKQYPFEKLPSLPPKSPFQNPFHVNFVEKRKEALEAFLAKLLSSRIFLSSRALHLFLQTTTSMVTIKDIVDGKVSDVLFLPPCKSIHEKYESDDANTTFEEDESQDNLPFEDASDLLPEFSSSSQVVKKVSFCDQVTVAEIHVQ